MIVRKQAPLSYSLVTLNFFWIDIWEDQYQYPGELFLFGKVLNRRTRMYESCTLWVPDFQRTVYLLPHRRVSESDMESACGELMRRYLLLRPGEWRGRVV